MRLSPSQTCSAWSMPPLHLSSQSTQVRSPDRAQSHRDVGLSIFGILSPISILSQGLPGISLQVNLSRRSHTWQTRQIWGWRL